MSSFIKRLGERILGTPGSSSPPIAPPAVAAPAPPSASSPNPAEQILSGAVRVLRTDGARTYVLHQASADARQLMAMGQTGLARSLLTQALAEHPLSELRALLVSVLRQRGEHGPALQLLRALALEDGHTLDAELQMGEIHEDLGEHAASRRHYERALAVDPAHPSARDRARRVRARLEGTYGLPPETWREMGRLWGEAAAGPAYRIMDEVGRGGAATLFQAVHGASGRSAALKVFHPRGDPAIRAERIRREAALMVRGAMDGVVPIWDAAPERDLVVMPYLAEGSLRARLPSLRKQPGEGLRLLAGVADILAELHTRGIAHLDVKPSNILLRAGQPVLADFGAAAARELGQAAGTPPYLAPEVAREQTVDGRADLFAIGVVLVELFTGAPQTHVRSLAGTIDGSWGRGVHHLADRLLQEDPSVRLGDARVAADLLRTLARAAESDVR